MKKLDSNLECPSCKAAMAPRVLGCDACQVRVEGHFSFNEFSALTPDMLHVLRIFVHCEGRIKDMEKALGVSYPTVKAEMGKLRAALNLGAEMSSSSSEEAAAPRGPAPDRLAILAAMERGDLNYQEGLRLLKKERS